MTKKPVAALGLLLACLPLAGPAPASYAEPVRTVSRADVTGDGRADRVTLRKVDGRTCRIGVTTAEGRRLGKTITNDGNPCGWHGAAAFDTRPGAELSVLTLRGAHSQFHTILTVRQGRLVTERMPGRADGRWFVDGAATVSSGLRRLANGHIVERVAFLDDQRGTWPGRRTEFAYSKVKVKWVVVKRSTYTTDAEGAGKTSGWHVKGLPRWAVS